MTITVDDIKGRFAVLPAFWGVQQRLSHALDEILGSVAVDANLGSLPEAQAMVNVAPVAGAVEDDHRTPRRSELVQAAAVVADVEIGPLQDLGEVLLDLDAHGAVAAGETVDPEGARMTVADDRVPLRPAAGRARENWWNVPIVSGTRLQFQ